jgi:dolichol-phosphate mannosyltransferase
MKKISIVVPVYNEENLIGELFSRILNFDSLNYKKEVIFINDGSRDKTINELIKYKNAIPVTNCEIIIIDLSRNFGHQLAITAGLDYATGDAIVFIDGDLQDPPEFITEFLHKWEDGYDVVYGIREKRKGETFFKLITAKLFYRTLSLLTETKIPNDVGDFRLIDKKVGLALKEIKENNRFIRGLVSWVGFKSIGLKYIRDKRYAGSTKFSLLKMLKFSMDGIISFSTRPLYLATIIGVLFSFSSMLWGLLIIIKYISGHSDAIIGWSSLMVVLLFVGGLNLLFIGVIGLYIGRIYNETKRRPLYLINNIH